MAAADLAQLIEQYHESLGAFIQGDPEPTKRLWSRRDDVTLANPFGPPVRGWQQVADAIDRATAQVHGGEVLGVERISAVETADLAYVVEIERGQTKFGGRDDSTPYSLRVTSVFRREDGAWRLVHRHADPITTARSLESVLER